MTEIRIIDKARLAETFEPSNNTYVSNAEEKKLPTISSRKKIGALLVAAAVVSGGAGAVLAVSVIDKPVVQPIAPKEVPENPLPAMPEDETSEDVVTPNADDPLFVDYKLSSLSFGVAGKDCKPHGSYYIEPTKLPITLNKKPYRLEIPKTVVGLYSCGTDVKAFVDNEAIVESTLLGVDGSEVPVRTYKKNVLINNDSIDFTAKIISKEVPKIIPLSAAQQMKDKAYNGQDICASYPELEGCNGEFDISKKQANQVIATAQLFAVQAISKLCSDNEYTAFKSANAKLFDTDASNQYFSPDLVSETYANSALEPIESLPNYDDTLVALLDKRGAIQDNNKLQTIFGSNPTVVAKCDMEVS